MMSLSIGQKVYVLNIEEQDLYEGDIRQPIQREVTNENLDELQELADEGKVFDEYKQAYRETMRIVIRGYKIHRPDVSYDHKRGSLL